MTVVALPPWIGPEISRLDRALVRVVLAMRMRRALSQQELCGLLVSDAQIDAALAGQGRPPPWSSGPPPAPPTIGPPTPWQRIAARLDLSPTERDVLLLGLAAQLDRRYEAVFAYLNDSMGLRAPTVDLALRTFEGSPGIADALAPGGRLARTGAIAFSEPHRPCVWRAQLFAASDVIAFAVLGADPLSLFAALSEVEPGRAPALRLAAPRGGVAPLLHVTGAIAENRVAAAAGMMAGLGLRPVVVEPALATATDLRPIALASRLFPLGVILPAGAPDLAAAALACWPRDVPLALAGDPPPSEVDRPVVAVAAPATAAAEAAAIWRRNAGCSGDAARLLARSFAFGPRKIGRIAASARLAGGGEAALVDAARAAQLTDFGPLARHVPSHRPWDDLILPAPTARALEDVAIAVEHRRQVLLDWGFGPERGGGALSILFTGAPGTGKSMAAGALAGRTGLNLYRIDLSAVVDKYIGETEKNLERIFNATGSCDSMLLFDEADALFGKRAETRDARDRYANLEVSYLLQRIESLPPGMVVILTTNLAKNMDQAFARRLTHVVDFPRPTPALRRRMWARIFPRATPVEPGLDLDPAAEAFDLTGGEIRQVALDAAFRAAGAGRAIGQGDIAAALRRHFEKLGRAAPEHALTAIARPGRPALPAAE